MITYNDYEHKEVEHDRPVDCSPESRVLLLTDGEEHNREGRNSQKLARKRENSGSKRNRVGENEMLGVGQGEGRDE